MGVFTGYPNLGQATPAAPAGDPWTFPSSDASPPPELDTGDVTASGIVLGSIGVNTDPSSVFNGEAALELAPVPEPSSIALVVVGLLGAVGMIRSRCK